jgi:hypothetical protein
MILAHLSGRALRRRERRKRNDNRKYSERGKGEIREIFGQQGGWRERSKDQNTPWFNRGGHPTLAPVLLN